MESETSEQQLEETNGKQTKASLYKTVWRWHFYAGLIFAPFLIILAVTGSVYLFKPQIEQILYQDLNEVTIKTERIPASEQLNIVKNHYTGAEVTSYRPGEKNAFQ